MCSATSVAHPATSCFENVGVSFIENGRRESVIIENKTKMPDRASDAKCNHSMQLLLISLGFHRRKKKRKNFWWQTHRQTASISFSSSTFHYSNQLPLSTFIFLLQIYVVKLLCTLKYLKESSKLSEQLSVLK